MFISDILKKTLRGQQPPEITPQWCGLLVGLGRGKSLLTLLLQCIRRRDLARLFFFVNDVITQRIYFIVGIELSFKWSSSAGSENLTFGAKWQKWKKKSSFFIIIITVFFALCLIWLNVKGSRLISQLCLGVQPSARTGSVNTAPPAED